MLKYIYMGTPQIAAKILESLCEHEYPPSLVVTQTAKPKGRGYKVTPSEVELYAKTQDLNVIEALDVNAPGTVDVLRTFHPDLILVVAFGQILKEPILKLPRFGCLNVHASLLPQYRGAAPVQRAIWDGQKETGVTIQKIVRKLDAGDVFLQKNISIGSEETSGELLNRLADLGAELLLESIKKAERGEMTFTPQDESQATYAKKIEKADADINWEKSALQICNQIRALQPWPVAQFSFNGEILRVFKAKVVSPQKSKGVAGSIDTDKKSYLEVLCGDGQAITLLEVQQDGRKRLSIGDFLKGYRWPTID